MPWFVYVLRSEKDGKHYFGCTQNLAERLALHNAGQVQSTRNRRPFVLVHMETFGNRAEAFCREKYLKSWAGRIEFSRMFPRGERVPGSGPDCG